MKNDSPLERQDILAQAAELLKAADRLKMDSLLVLRQTREDIEYTREAVRVTIEWMSRIRRTADQRRA